MRFFSDIFSFATNKKNSLETLFYCVFVPSLLTRKHKIKSMQFHSSHQKKRAKERKHTLYISIGLRKNGFLCLANGYRYCAFPNHVFAAFTNNKINWIWSFLDFWFFRDLKNARNANRKRDEKFLCEFFYRSRLVVYRHTHGHAMCAVLDFSHTRNAPVCGSVWLLCCVWVTSNVDRATFSKRLRNYVLYSLALHMPGGLIDFFLHSLLDVVHYGVDESAMQRNRRRTLFFDPTYFTYLYFLNNIIIFISNLYTQMYVERG